MCVGMTCNCDGWAGCPCTVSLLMTNWQSVLEIEDCPTPFYVHASSMEPKDFEIHSSKVSPVGVLPISLGPC